MSELNKVLGMGEYGMYVWPSFIVAAVVILSMIAITLRSLHQTQKTLIELQKYREQQ